MRRRKARGARSFPLPGPGATPAPALLPRTPLGRDVKLLLVGIFVVVVLAVIRMLLPWPHRRHPCPLLGYSATPTSPRRPGARGHATARARPPQPRGPGLEEARNRKRWLPWRDVRGHNGPTSRSRLIPAAVSPARTALVLQGRRRSGARGRRGARPGAARPAGAPRSIDGHNDLPWAIRERQGAPRRRGRLRPPAAAPPATPTSPGCAQGGVGGQFWSVYIPGEIKAAATRASSSSRSTSRGA